MTFEAARASDAMRGAVARMPMLREMVASLRASGTDLGPNTIVFGVQHIMDQALALCWALNELGISFDRIALCGKAYSTCPASAAALSELGVAIEPPRCYDLRDNQREDLVADVRSLAARTARRKAGLPNPSILVLDDGGQALTNLFNILAPPFSAAGVEQTASGFWQTGIRSVPIPIVDVGSSAIKRLCEPPLVIEAVLARARKALEAVGRVERVGIVGLGFIGLSLSKALQRDGYRLAVYDTRTDAYYKLHAARSRRVHEVVDRSEVIFGCTGTDLTETLAADVAERGLSERARTFMSLSSGDDEFFSLKTLMLRKTVGATRYEVGKIPDIRASLWGSDLTIARNGFPINFDNGSESAPLEQIQGTICALVAGLCQARLRLRPDMGMTAGQERLVLDLDIQHWLLRRWRAVLPFPLMLRSRRISPTPRRSVLDMLSRARTVPESIVTAPCFGNWTAD